MVGDRGREGQKIRSYLAWTEFQFCKMKRVLGLRGGQYLTCIKNSLSLNFMFCVFVIIFNWKNWVQKKKIIWISKSRKGYREHTLGVSWLDVRVREVQQVKGWGRSTFREGKEKYKRGQHDYKGLGKPGWHMGMLHRGRQEERMGKRHWERVWKAVHIRSLPLPHSRRFHRSPSLRAPSIPWGSQASLFPRMNRDIT